MKYFLLTIFLLCSLVSLAQPNCPYYEKYLYQGDSILKTQSATKFEDAIKKYNIALLHCPEKADTAMARIEAVFKSVKQLKNEAESAKYKLQVSLKQLKEQKAKADSLHHRADSLFKIADTLVKAFYFYADRFALAYGNKDAFGNPVFYSIDKKGEKVAKLGEWKDASGNPVFYFIDKKGEKVAKLGEWDEAEMFERTTTLARVQKESVQYLLDTFGNDYPVAYSIEELRENITALDLSSQSLDTLPDFLFKHTQLKILLLNGNNLNNLPAEIGHLKNLIHIDFSENELDSLPAEIGQLKNLAVLNLSQNKLKSLPNELLHMDCLRSLDLTFNLLDSLPPEIYQIGLSNLDWNIRVSHNTNDKIEEWNESISEEQRPLIDDFNRYKDKIALMLKSFRITAKDAGIGKKGSNYSDPYFVVFTISESNFGTQQINFVVDAYPKIRRNYRREFFYGKSVYYGPENPGAFLVFDILLMESDNDVQAVGERINSIMNSIEVKRNILPMMAGEPNIAVAGEVLSATANLVGTTLQKNKDDQLLRVHGTLMRDVMGADDLPFNVGKIMFDKNDFAEIEFEVFGIKNTDRTRK